MNEREKSPEDYERQGLKEFNDGHFEASVRLFTLAQNSHLAQGDQGKTAQMANNLCVVYLKMKRHTEALEAVEGTPEVFLGLDDTLRAAQAYGNLGSALEASGDLVRAEENYRLAAQLFDEVGDGEQHAYTLQALSRLQIRQGQPIKAVATMQESIDTIPKPSIRDRILRRLLKIPFRTPDR
jgi:tetratricopeptide (TPR) repeat protein